MEGADTSSNLFLSLSHVVAALPSGYSFDLHPLNKLNATLPSLVFVSIDKMSSVKATSLISAFFYIFFPSSKYSSKLSSNLGIDNLSCNKSLNPYLLALARNFSLQTGHSSTFQQKGIPLMVLTSVMST
jgi:hypothetical protein